MSALVQSVLVSALVAPALELAVPGSDMGGGKSNSY
jgi:hypothetical protein